MKQFVPILFLVICVSVNAATDKICAATHSAAANQTILVTGDFNTTATWRFSDGTTVADATVITTDTYLAVLILPDTLSTGTLWVWVVDGGNSVTINAPEPWWAFPDDPDIGDGIRIFGRNFSLFSSPTMNVVLEAESDGSTYVYTATVVSPTECEVTIAAKDNNGNTISRNDDYRIWVDEWKTGGAWNSLDYSQPVLTGSTGSTITVVAPTDRPASSYTVTNYGVTPNDSISDTEAILTLISDLSSSGGGTLYFPAGTYNIDEGNGTHNYLIRVLSNCHIEGAGEGQTIFECEWTTPCGYTSSPCFYFYDSHISLSSATINMVGNNWPTTHRFFSTRGSAGDPDLSTSITVQHLALNADGSSMPATFAALQCWRGRAEYLEIWSLGRLAVDGRQIRVANCTHHGGRGLHKYTGTDPQSAGGAFIQNLGGREILVEHNHIGSDRWDSEYGIMRRFYNTSDANGSVGHVAILNNTIDAAMTQPWSNTGEQILNESGKDVYHIDALAGISGTSITLSHSIADVTAKCFNNPLTVVVVGGPGLGQVRRALYTGATTLLLDEAFTVEPDSGSSVAVAFGWHENIVYGNSIKYETVAAECHSGVQMWTKGADNIFNTNSFDGAYYMDAVVRSDDELYFGYYYWNEVTSNTFQNCLYPIWTGVQEANGVSRPRHMSVGNLYRGNTISQCNLTLPQWDMHTTLAAMSINDTMWHAADDIPASPVTCPIYENNTVTTARRGFVCERIAWMPILRNNTFTSITQECYNIQIGDWYEDDTSSNSMPQVFVSGITTGDRYWQSFGRYNPITASQRMGRKRWAIWIVSEDQGGSISTTTSDADSDAVTLSGSSGLTVGGDGDISWSGLTAGVNRLEIYANDGSETATIPFTIYSGVSHDPFDDIQLTAVDATTSQLQTTVRTYNMTVVRDLADSAYSIPSEIDLSIDESTTAGKFIVSERQVRLSPTTTTGQTFHRSLLCFRMNHYNTTSGSFTVRLKESSSRYYEFAHRTPYHFSQNHHNYACAIRRVYDGAETDIVTSMSAHRTDGPVECYTDNGDVWFRAFGETLYWNDLSPLSIGSYEIDMETTSPASYWTVDDISFWQDSVIGGDTTTQTWVNDRAGPDYLKWEVTTDDSGIYEELSTLTLTGKLFQITVVPGAGADQPTNGFRVKVLFGGAESVSFTCSNTERQMFPAKLEAMTGFQELSSAKPQLWISGAGDSKLVEVQFHVL